MRTISAGQQRAHVLVVGALSSLERLMRTDGIPLGEHVPRQVALALRSAADLLDPPAARFDGLLVRENAFVPDGEVWVRPPAALSVPDALARYTKAAARIRVGEPYPACCYPEAAVAVEMKHVEFSGTMSCEEADRLLEREADGGRVERRHAEGI